MGSANDVVWFLLASGPSQRQADIDRIRGLGYVIAVNSAVFMAPWADELYAGDGSWWKEYGQKIPPEFTGKRLTISPYYYRYGAERIPYQMADRAGFGKTCVRTGGNSGFVVLNRAILMRPKAVCLLGYDYQHTNDKKHCHPDHPGSMGNAGNVERWVINMNIAARDTFGVPVINCTRETALECFQRMLLEDFIREYCDS